MRLMLPAIVLVLCLPASSPGQAPSGGAATAIKAADALVAQGRLDEAAAKFREAAGADAESAAPLLGLGRVLDLQGQHTQARDAYVKAASLGGDTDRDAAYVATAISFVFEGQVEQAVRAYRPIYGLQVQDGNSAAAAGTANALGRIYLEAGELANARKWYDGARDAIAGARGLPEADALLWEMRHQHALARIAARGERHDDAKQHVATFAKLMKQRGLPQDDAAIYQYLLGYVAYYAKDFKTAVAELQKADQRDPFIVDLLGRAHEGAGDLAAAREQYHKVLESTQHSLQNAFARPHAQARLVSIGR